MIMTSTKYRDRTSPHLRTHNRASLPTPFIAHRRHDAKCSRITSTRVSATMTCTTFRTRRRQVCTTVLRRLRMRSRHCGAFLPRETRTRPTEVRRLNRTATLTQDSVRSTTWSVTHETLAPVTCITHPHLPNHRLPRDSHRIFSFSTQCRLPRNSTRAPPSPRPNPPTAHLSPPTAHPNPPTAHPTSTSTNQNTTSRLPPSTTCSLPRSATAPCWIDFRRRTTPPPPTLQCTTTSTQTHLACRWRRR